MGRRTLISAKNSSSNYIIGAQSIHLSYTIVSKFAVAPDVPSTKATTGLYPVRPKFRDREIVKHTLDMLQIYCLLKEWNVEAPVDAIIGPSVSTSPHESTPSTRIERFTSPRHVDQRTDPSSAHPHT